MDMNQANGQNKETALSNIRGKYSQQSDFVLEKNIFSNVFEKDIVKVFIYKKTERLAKAIHLITPAFADSPSLRNRLDAIAIGLIDAAVVSSASARENLARELLTLSSVLAIARTGGLLSQMNADLIAREAQSLLQEVAAYAEPRLALEEVPSLAQMMKNIPVQKAELVLPTGEVARKTAPVHKGQIKDIGTNTNNRRAPILSVIKDKQNASIKDISTRIRGISEKTIQRELQALVGQGIIVKRGERRWSTYSLV